MDRNKFGRSHCWTILVAVLTATMFQCNTEEHPINSSVLNFSVTPSVNISVPNQNSSVEKQSHTPALLKSNDSFISPETSSQAPLMELSANTSLLIAMESTAPNATLGSKSKPNNFNDVDKCSFAKASPKDIEVGPCKWIVNDRWPDENIKFYLHTRRNVLDRQYIHMDQKYNTNLTDSHFDPRHSTKVIIHGYNADMFMSPLYELRQEYLAKAEHNIIFIDWRPLALAPCYMSAVHNIKHVGKYAGIFLSKVHILSERPYIHIIGFSLGAHVTNYIAQTNLFPINRITGLDPALPLFALAANKDKLDASDAEFVDVIHTNALVQGKIEQCGHADFYMNGGILQPGCDASGFQPFACSHQRAAVYFLESVRSRKGFWGWSCSSYLSYMLGLCPPTNYLVEAGENARASSKGMFIVQTNSTAPFAVGKWTDLPELGKLQLVTYEPVKITVPPVSGFRDPIVTWADRYNKLESGFNNLPDNAGLDDNWRYYQNIYHNSDISDYSDSSEDSGYDPVQFSD